MGTLLHLILRFKGKGIWVLPVIGISFAVVYAIEWLANSKLGMSHDRYTNGFLYGLSFIVAGVINSYVTRNYTVDIMGQRHVYEVEGEYLTIKVSFWTYILIALGFVIIAANFADMLHL